MKALIKYCKNVQVNTLCLFTVSLHVIYSLLHVSALYGVSSENHIATRDVCDTCVSPYKMHIVRIYKNVQLKFELYVCV